MPLEDEIYLRARLCSHDETPELIQEEKLYDKKNSVDIRELPDGIVSDTGVMRHNRDHR